MVGLVKPEGTLKVVVMLVIPALVALSDLDPRTRIAPRDARVVRRGLSGSSGMLEAPRPIMLRRVCMSGL